MRPSSKLLSTAVALVALLGAPPLLTLLLSADDSSQPVDTAAAHRAAVREATDPGRAALVELARRRSTLAQLYDRWEKGYEARGGDHNVQIDLTWDRALSKATSTARGWAKLDLLTGSVAALVRGLDGPSDLWLVENRPGPGMDSRPQPGDRMVRLGRFTGTGDARLRARLGAHFFDDFEIDLLVVTPAGRSPDEEGVLFGHRSVIERSYTRARLSREGVTPHSAPEGAAGWVASVLGSLLSPERAFANSTSILIAHNLVSQQVGDGADLFFRGTFSGNGRTCATCHPQSNNQTIDPDFIADLPSTDKLFIATQAGGVPGLERPGLLAQEALILENRDGFEDPTVKFVARGVPHSLSMSTSILQPADGRPEGERTGWGGDAGTLNGFSNGAITQHFTKSLDRIVGTDFRLATQSELDSMEAFMLASGRLNELDLAGASLSDPAADSGRLLFLNQGKCNNCHGNAGANASFGGGGNRNFDTGVEDFPHPARTPGEPEFVEVFPLDGGFGLQPVDIDGDGTPDLFGDETFNVAPLIEAADTGPFFHNDLMDMLEEAIDFFNSDEFNDSPGGAAVGGISLTPIEVAEIGKFLRVINAGLNLDVAVQRIDAGISLENSKPPKGIQGTSGIDEGGDVNGSRATVNALLALANIENADALEDLQPVGLHPSAVSSIQSAVGKISQAIATNSSQGRKSLMQSARSDLLSARGQFGSGFDFTVGEGNLLF